ncbi:PQQ-binding-like beta-propeller repeat protein [Gemmata sp. G18]|uniref:PQQ-binding-like beta-propeller repeat protein n=1 Tax=Gemmata palustris TaxID=2822762 RepID=A0ABS5C379_9BACT|nr:PQQ-binding-like beta-propeller repeat protein [Gemmata palustris]
MVYVQVGQDKAEIQSRPFANAIPAADVNAKSDVKRVEVPAGDTVSHNGKVFLSTARELLVIDTECRIDWRFVLPGKADNGEQLLGAVGFHDGKVYLASRNESKGSTAEKTGRVYMLDVATGRQTGFDIVRGGFGDQPKFSSRAGVVYAISATGVIRYNAVEQRQSWTTKLTSTEPHPAADVDYLFATLANGFGAVHGARETVLLGSSQATAPATPFGTVRAHGLLAPTRNAANVCSLVLFKYDVLENRSQVWRLPVKDAITTAPVIHGDSVYFVSGAVVYRVSAATGAVCWKQTVSLNANESLTDLALVDGELRASGGGVLVRVADRVDPKPQQIFNFGGGFGTLWGSK